MEPASRTSQDGSDTPEQSEKILARGTQQEIIDLQLRLLDNQTGYFALYRFADLRDLILIFVCCITAIAAGVAFPLMTIVFGNFSGSLSSFGTGDTGGAALDHKIRTYSLYFVYIGMAYL
jgi:ATP-binding cassette, subfamily B (MDR/TAP), member 1